MLRPVVRYIAQEKKTSLWESAKNLSLPDSQSQGLVITSKSLRSTVLLLVGTVASEFVCFVVAVRFHIHKVKQLCSSLIVLFSDS